MVNDDIKELDFLQHPFSLSRVSPECLQSESSFSEQTAKGKETLLTGGGGEKKVSLGNSAHTSLDRTVSTSYPSQATRKPENLRFLASVDGADKVQ